MMSLGSEVKDGCIAVIALIGLQLVVGSRLWAFASIQEKKTPKGIRIKYRIMLKILKTKIPLI